jgi:hypothetical protein
MVLWSRAAQLDPLGGPAYRVTFKNLCESYLGIDPKFDLWNYFFRVRRPHDPDVELMIFGGVVIHV